MIISDNAKHNTFVGNQDLLRISCLEISRTVDICIGAYQFRECILDSESERHDGCILLFNVYNRSTKVLNKQHKNSRFHVYVRLILRVDVFHEAAIITHVSFYRTLEAGARLMRLLRLLDIRLTCLT